MSSSIHGVENIFRVVQICKCFEIEVKMKKMISVTNGALTSYANTLKKHPEKEFENVCNPKLEQSNEINSNADKNGKLLKPRLVKSNLCTLKKYILSTICY